MDYNFSGLNPDSFEHMVQALVQAHFGQGSVAYGTGPDGGRDSTFSGIAVVPSSSSPWNGHMVVQAKFRLRKYNDVQWLQKEVQKELTDWEMHRSTHPKPDYIIFASNVILSPVPNSGGKDKIMRVIEQFAPRLGLIAYDIWDYDQLCRLLDVHVGVRTTYLGSILSGDVLAKLYNALPAKSQEPELCTLYYSLQQRLNADRYDETLLGSNDQQQALAWATLYQNLPKLIAVRKEKLQPSREPAVTPSIRERLLALTQSEVEREATYLHEYERFLPKQSSLESVDWPDLLQDFQATLKRIDAIGPRPKQPALMLLAAPGGGKSTTLRWIWRQLWGGSLRQKCGAKWLPCYIPLRSLHSIWLQQGRPAINKDQAIKLLGDCVLATHHDELTHDTKRKWEQWWCNLSANELFFLLDGLDEIDSHFAVELERLVKIFLLDGYAMVVSCRFAAFGSHKNSFSDLAVFAMGGLALRAQRSYVSAYPGLTEKQQNALLNAIDNNPTLAPIATLPIGLAMICWLARQSDEELPLPQSTALLYRRFVERLLSTPRLGAGLPLIAPSFHTYSEALQRTSLLLFRAKAHQVEFSKGQWFDTWENQSEAELALNFLLAQGLLLEHCTRNQETQQQEIKLSFLHLTLHEYLAAASLASAINQNGWDAQVPAVIVNKEHFWHIHSAPRSISMLTWRNPALSKTSYTTQSQSASHWLLLACKDETWHQVLVLLAGLLKDPNPLLRNLAVAKKDDKLMHRRCLAVLCLTEALPKLQATSEGKATIDELITQVKTGWGWIENTRGPKLVSPYMHEHCLEAFYVLHKNRLLPDFWEIQVEQLNNYRSFYLAVLERGLIKVTPELIENIFSIFKYNEGIRSFALNILLKIEDATFVDSISKHLKNEDFVKSISLMEKVEIVMHLTAITQSEDFLCWALNISTDGLEKEFNPWIFHESCKKVNARGWKIDLQNHLWAFLLNCLNTYEIDGSRSSLDFVFEIAKILSEIAPPDYLSQNNSHICQKLLGYIENPEFYIRKMSLETLVMCSFKPDISATHIFLRQAHGLPPDPKWQRWPYFLRVVFGQYEESWIQESAIKLLHASDHISEQKYAEVIYSALKYSNEKINICAIDLCKENNSLLKANKKILLGLLTLFSSENSYVRGIAQETISNSYGKNIVNQWNKIYDIHAKSAGTLTTIVFCSIFITFEINIIAILIWLGLCLFPVAFLSLILGGNIHDGTGISLCLFLFGITIAASFSSAGSFLGLILFVFGIYITMGLFERRSKARYWWQFLLFLSSLFWGLEVQRRITDSDFYALIIAISLFLLFSFGFINAFWNLNPKRILKKINRKSAKNEVNSSDRA